MAWISLFNLCKIVVVKMFEGNSGGSDTTTNVKLSPVELKRLLSEISSYKPSTGFRCRQVGGMWMQRHCQVMTVNEGSVVLYDEKETKYTMVDINSVMQFDIDERFQNFHPHHHYTVAGNKP